MTASRTSRRSASRSTRMLEALESRLLMSHAPVTPAGTASISGTVFNDVNVNGTFDASDKGLSGRKVYIDANNNGRLDKGEISVRSKHGAYAFNGLAAGTYTVREVLPKAFRQTEPADGVRIITVADGQAVTAQDFGDTNLVQISGTVFNDANANGALDAGETGMSGWSVFLDKNKNGRADHNEVVTTTDANGNYVFNVRAGSYRVREVVQAGFTQTGPAGGFYTERLSAGRVVSGLNLGNQTGTPNPGPGPGPTDPFTISSTRVASSNFAGDDVVTFFAKNNGLGAYAGTHMILGEDSTLASPAGLVVRASGGNLDLAGTSVSPKASYISIGNGMMVSFTTPSQSTGGFTDMQTLPQFEVAGVLLGGVRADTGSGAVIAVAVVPHGASVSISGQLGAESGPVFNFSGNA